MMRRFGQHAAGKRGLSILEVLVALAILTAGMLTIMAIYPYTLRAQRDAELLSMAAALAQMKAEEIRRDDSNNGTLVDDIENLQTPSDPIVFPNEPRLAYSFCGETLLYQDLDPADPRRESNRARVLIRYATGFKASQDVIYELRFQ